MRVGYIGLGNMGGPMCRNLIKSGYSVIVHDLNPDAVERCTTLGASSENSPKEIARQADVVFTSLPNTVDVEKVVLGNDGILEGGHEGLIYVDMSTNLPSFVKKLASTLSQHGVAMLEAPILGSPSEVEAKSTSIVVGGNSETLEKVKPLFQSCFQHTFYTGGHGTGNTIKLVNNYLNYCNIAVAKEALMLGIKGGITPESMLTVLQACRGDSPFMQSVTRALSSENYKAEYAMDLSFFKSSSTGLTGKSLKMALELGEDIGVPLMFGNLLVNLLRQTQGLKAENVP